MKFQRLNYCRHFLQDSERQKREIEEYQRLYGKPRVGASIGEHGLTLDEEQEEAESIARRGVKFWVPGDWGKDSTCLDPHLRAIAGQQLRLPFPEIAIELSPPIVNPEQRAKLGRAFYKNIVFAKEIDGGERIRVHSATWFDHDRSWSGHDPCGWHLMYAGGPLGRAPFPDLVGPVQRPYSSRDDGYNFPIQVLLQFLNALACENVRAERSEPKSAGRKIRAALPFDAYYILTVGAPASSRASAAHGGSHRSPREHIRRGHIRRLPGDRRIWVNAAIVNAGRGAGVVHKDYQVMEKAARA